MKYVTTIKIEKETQARLNHLKEHEKESFDSVLKKILYILNVCKKNPEKAQKILHGIDIRIRKREIMKKRLKISS